MPVRGERVMAFPLCGQSWGSEAKWPARVPEILPWTPPFPAIVWFGPFPADLASSYLAFSPHGGLVSSPCPLVSTNRRPRRASSHKMMHFRYRLGLWGHSDPLLECSPHSLFSVLSFLNERCERSSLSGPHLTTSCQSGQVCSWPQIWPCFGPVWLGAWAQTAFLSHPYSRQHTSAPWHSQSQFLASLPIWF